jgi:hypothetical protein
MSGDARPRHWHSRVASHSKTRRCKSAKTAHSGAGTASGRTKNMPGRCREQRLRTDLERQLDRIVNERVISCGPPVHGQTIRAGTVIYICLLGIGAMAGICGVCQFQLRRSSPPVPTLLPPPRDSFATQFILVYDNSTTWSGRNFSEPAVDYYRGSRYPVAYQRRSPHDGSGLAGVATTVCLDGVVVPTTGQRIIFIIVNPACRRRRP